MSCPNPARDCAAESPVDPRPVAVDVDVAPLVCVALTIILGVAGLTGMFWILLTRPHP